MSQVRLTFRSPSYSFSRESMSLGRTLRVVSLSTKVGPVSRAYRLLGAERTVWSCSSELSER